MKKFNGVTWKIWNPKWCCIITELLLSLRIAQLSCLFASRITWITSVQIKYFCVKQIQPGKINLWLVLMWRLLTVAHNKKTKYYEGRIILGNFFVQVHPRGLLRWNGELLKEFPINEYESRADMKSEGQKQCKVHKIRRATSWHLEN